MNPTFYTDALVVPYIFAILSICICIGQIVLREKINILSACRISISLPVMMILAKAFKENYSALRGVLSANDISSGIWKDGIATMFEWFYIGLILTILLLIVYAITKSIYDSRIKQD